MERTEDVKVAIRDGIGARLLELGFEQRSGRRYQREDACFIDVVAFELKDGSVFRDVCGVIWKEFQADADRFGVKSGVYGLLEPFKAHVWRSAFVERVQAESAGIASLQRRLRFLGPLKWLAPWDQVYARAIKRAGCAGTGWAASPDPAACAEASCRDWRQLVEPMLLRARDPKTFVEEYAGERWRPISSLAHALALAKSGDIEAARQRLLAEYRLRLRQCQDPLLATETRSNEPTQLTERTDLEKRALAKRQLEVVQAMGAAIGASLPDP